MRMVAWTMESPAEGRAAEAQVGDAEKKGIRFCEDTWAVAVRRDLSA